MRELRHDFRAIYHVSYDDVPIDEAVDLILTLPAGAQFRAARNPATSWTRQDYMMANVIDLLSVLCWRAAGSPSASKPEPMERPADELIRKQARERAHAMREQIIETKWKDVSDG